MMTMGTPLVILSGPTGAGQGTQGLARKVDFGPVPLSSGDHLREAAKAGTKVAFRPRAALARIAGGEPA
jgi:adenylate kinase